jgi:DNA-binding helix-hairpin-helix protein with protein kinase domain
MANRPPPGNDPRAHTARSNVAAVPQGMPVQTSDRRTILCVPEPFSYGSEGRLFYSVDHRAVVKLYNRPEAWREASLQTIIKKRASVMGDHVEYWSRYFCWPEALVMRPGLGVFMPRARSGLRPFAQFLAPRFRKRLAVTEGPAVLGTWIGHVGILIKLARTVNRLHNNGLCHSDLSTNNLLVNPATGDATLIDCDGLVETGSNILLPTVLGTPDYMAPELVIGMTPRHGVEPPQPTVGSDLHSLAVLIYQGLLFRHPLRGNKFHSPDPDEDERLMLGRNALYIEHSTDHSNRPKGTFLKSSILGKTMQDLFARAFVDGLHHPSKRPYAAEWEGALVRLYDQTLPCSNPDCEAKSFVFVEGGSARCPWCHTEAKGPRQVPILSFCKPDGKLNSTMYPVDFRLVGWPKRTLHTWHVELGKLPGPGVEAAPLAEFRWEPDPRTRTHEIWTLHNLAAPQMHHATSGTPIPIPPGHGVALRDGVRLIFGSGDRARVVEVRMQGL